MLTLERLNILRKAFDRATCSGLHNHVQPPPISFASELVGLIARKFKDISASRHTDNKIKDSFVQILTSHSNAAFQNWALVTKKNGIPPWLRPQIPPLMEWAPKGQSVWGKHQCLLLLIFWVLHLPSHLPWKHHALRNKTRHLLCCCQHRGNSHIHAPPFLKWKHDYKFLCITLPQIPSKC